MEERLRLLELGQEQNKSRLLQHAEKFKDQKENINRFKDDVKDDFDELKKSIEKEFKLIRFSLNQQSDKLDKVGWKVFFACSGRNAY